MNVFSALWGGWLLCFVLIEAAALYHSGTGDTFSEWMWTFMAGGWSRTILVAGFLVWLTVHLVFRGRFG